MKFDFYINRGDYSGEAKRLVDESLFEANQTLRIRQSIYYRSIICYLRTNTGFSRVIDGDYPRIYLHLGDNAGKILSQINSLYDIFEPVGLLKEIVNFPYIANSLPNYKHGKIWDVVKPKYEKFGREHPEYIEYGCSAVEFDSECSCIKRGWGLCKSVDNLDLQKELPFLVDYADNLLYELSHFKLNINKLTKKQNKSNTLNLGLSPKLEKALVIGGIFIVKAAVKVAAKSIGSDADINIDYSDTNVEIPEFDFDITNNNDFDNSNCNISFLGADTLPPGANEDGFIRKGNITLTKTISGGTESFKHFVDSNGNDFVLYNSHYIRVDGPATSVRIGGVNYKTI